MNACKIPQWETVIEHLRSDLHWSESTIERSRSVYHKFTQVYCREGGDAKEQIENGIEAVSIAFEQGLISRDQLLRMRRMAYRMLMLLDNECISWDRVPRYGQEQGNERHETLLAEFIAEDSHAESIQKRDEGIVRQYILYAEKQKSKDILEMNVQDVLDFLKCMKVRRRAGLKSVVSAMKHFYGFLIGRGMVNENLMFALKSWDTPHLRTHGILSQDEKNALLNAIDVSTDIGKRDYAIFSLAIDCGIRSADITALKLEDIQWKTSSISIVQSKTKKPLVVPFSRRTGDALANYILNARGSTSLRNIFVKESYFDRRMTSSLLCQRLKHYLKKAGIERPESDKIGMHTFRRSLGSELIDNGTDLEMIAQVLGHADTNATKRYLSFSGQTLKNCAIDMELLPCIREGLYE